METENKEIYVIDTSALLTLLEDEEGANEVESILKNKPCILPFLVLLEVYYVTLREKGETVANIRYAIMKNLKKIIWEIDEPTLLQAGKFKGTYNISLADAMIAAFAKTLGAILVHKDPEYHQLKGEIRQFPLPYKHS